MKALDWKQILKDWLASGTLKQSIPEVTALEGVPQPHEYHSEGDALTHTLLAIDAVKPEADERVFWAVLLHDIGKTTTTTFVDGRWRSHGHVNEGAKLAPKILERFELNPISNDVIWLIKNHHFALDWGECVYKGLTNRQRRFCSLPLFPLLVEVCEADAVGSIGRSDKGKRLAHILSQLPS